MAGGIKDYPPGNATYQRPTKSSKLLIRKEIDEADSLDVTWSEYFRNFEILSENKSETDVTTALQQKLNAPNQDRNETAAQIYYALLYGILTDRQNHQNYFKYLSHIVHDGFALCVGQLKRLVLEKYTKLLDPCKDQLIWLVSELIKMNIREIDIVCCYLLRQIPSGDLSARSILLTETLLQLFIDNRGWFLSSSELIQATLYTYLRLIADHNKPTLHQLKEKEVRFVIEVIREKFDECKMMGRDFVRLLQDVAKIPQFTDLWKDLLQKPQSLSPQFTDLSQLLLARTPYKLFNTRVTPDMEKQLLFILQKVTLGNQKRYQQWFTQCFLTAPESETLVCDLIRYICGGFHPPNSILSSDIVQRWAIIGWLLNTVKTSPIQANAKLALFYDWLFFNPQIDSIMNIEPAMLLMIYSIPKYAPFSAQLLEFLISTMEQYFPPCRELMKKGIRNSLKIMLSKGVTPNIEPLVNCAALEPQVRQKVLHCFAPFLSQPQAKPLPPPSQNATNNPPSSSSSSNNNNNNINNTNTSHQPPSHHPPTSSPVTGNSTTIATIDDKKDKLDASHTGENVNSGGTTSSSTIKGEENSAMEIDSGNNTHPSHTIKSEHKSTTNKQAQSQSQLQQLSGIKTESNNEQVYSNSLQSLINQIKDQIKQNQPHEILSLTFKTFLDAFCEEHVKVQGNDAKQKLMKTTAKFLLLDMQNKFVSFDENQALLRELVNKQPLIDLLHARLHENQPNSHVFHSLSDLLLEIRRIEPRSGFQFLIYLCFITQTMQKDSLNIENLSSNLPAFKKLKKISNNNENKQQKWNHLAKLLGGISHVDAPANVTASHFKSYFTVIKNNKQAYLDDCRYCAETDSASFFWMVPHLCKFVAFSRHPTFVATVISHVDPIQFAGLLGGLIKGSFKLIEDNLTLIALQSLEWESYDQSIFWQIVKMECSASLLHQHVPTILQKLNPDLHVEALSGLFLLLKDTYNHAIVEAVATLPTSFNLFPSDLLCYWFQSAPQTILPTLQKIISDLTDNANAAKTENFLIQLTMWIHRAPVDCLNLLTDEFVGKHLTPFIAENDDHGTFTNLPAALRERKVK